MRFEKLLEAVPDALVGMDQKGVIRFVNGQTESLFDCDRDDLIGQHIEKLVPEPLWQIYAQNRDQYFADPRTRSSGLEVELVGRRRDGTEFPINLALSHIDTGDVLLVITAVADVTRRMVAVRNAELIAAMVEYSDDAIMSGTLEGTITSWNPAAEKMYGYTSKEMIGRSARILTPDDRADEWSANVAKGKAGQPVEHFETERVRKDGTPVPVSLTVAPIHDEDGAVVGVSVVHRDVTEQRQALETAQLAAAIVEASDDAIVSITLDAIVTSWNPAAARMYGYSREETIGRSGRIMVDPGRAADVTDVLARVETGAVVEHLEVHHVRKDGTAFPVSVTVAPISNADGVVVGACVVARDVTERRRALEAAQRMAAIVEGSEDAIFGSTLEGTITSWNPAAERLFGYSSEEMVGASGRHLSPRDRTEEIRTILAKVGAGKRIEHLETIRVRKDGTVLPVSLTVSPIRDANGAVVGASAINRNMTELRHAGLYARSLIEAAPDPMMTISPEGTINDVNEATVGVTGVPRDELIATDFCQYFTDPDKAHAAYEQAFTHGSVTNYPLTVRHQDGSLTDLACNASVYRGVNGNVLGVLAAGRDVTEQKKAFEVTQRLASIVEYSQDAIISGSLDGIITSWNPAAERLFGYSSEDIVGKPASVLIPKDRSGQVQEILDKIKAGQHVKEFETQRVRKDGAVFPISLTVSPLRDADGVIIGTSVIYRDLTEQKRAEQAVKQERDLLRATMDSLMDPHVLFEAVRDDRGQIVDLLFADANFAACAYIGIPFQDLVGSRMLEHYPGLVGAGLLEQFAQVVETGGLLRLDDVVYAVETMDGQDRHVDISAARVEDGLSYTWRDVTDRHKVAQWLAESEEHFRLLAENASDVVMRLSPDRRFEWVSGSVADVLGWAANDLLGQVIDEFIHPEDLASFRQSVAGTSPESVASTEFRFRRSDGSYRWVLCHTRLNTAQGGAPVDLVGGLIDIEARKAVEAHEMDRLETLERFQRLTLGRELKMIELKKEIESLRGLVHKDGDGKSDNH